MYRHVDIVEFDELHPKLQSCSTVLTIHTLRRGAYTLRTSEDTPVICDKNGHEFTYLLLYLSHRMTMLLRLQGSSGSGQMGLGGVLVGPVNIIEISVWSVHG